MGKTYVKNADLAFGWCTECQGVIGDYPLLNPYWHVSTSIAMHIKGTGHHVRRVSHQEAWAQWMRPVDTQRSLTT